MNGRNISATGHDILVIMIWIGLLGKALVSKGVIEKKDLTNQVAEFRPSCPPEVQLEIDNLVRTIASW
jgi:hypothetical protein